MDFFFVHVVFFLENNLLEYFLLTVKSLISSVTDLKFGSLCTRQFFLHLFRNLAKLELCKPFLVREEMEVFWAAFPSDGACTATGRPVAVYERFAKAELEEAFRS